MNKLGVAFLPVIVLALIALGAAGYYGLINVGEITGSSGEYIERPVFKYVKCEATAGLVKSQEYPIDKAGTWVTPPSSTDKYNVIIITPRDTIGRVKYYVCNSKVISKENCDIYDNPESVSETKNVVTIFNVRPTEQVFVNYNSLLGIRESRATWQISFVPFGLREYDVLSGASGAITSNDCTVPATDDSWTDRLISTDSNKLNAKRTGNIKYERTLQPNEVRWYVSGYLTSAAPSFKLNYKGQEAWCKKDGATATIYKINKVVLGSGTYKIASVDLNDILGTETCCPGDKEPGRACATDFKWVSMQPIDNSGITKVSCNSFNPCDGGSWTPLSAGVIARYACVEGACKLTTKQTECANDLDCKDANKICDKNAWTCVDANVNLKGQVIVTQADNEMDCEDKGGVWVKENSERKKWYNYVGIGSPEVVVREYCDQSSWFDDLPWATAVLLLALGGVVYLFRSQIAMGYRATIGRFL